ncbi:MAG: GH3 auxin-responsive promoter family protein, partial [Rhodocyclaceae bacterium]
MTDPIWSSLFAAEPDDARQAAADWLGALLERNRDTAYLARFGRPGTIEAFRDSVPVCDYEDLVPWLDRMEAGAADVLFAGQPVAYELTGGSSGGSKLIPYSAEGLRDFQQAIVPWLARTLANYDIRGKVYFSISPAGREAQFRGGLPVGLPDGAYLGETAGAVLARMTAVPFSVAGIRDLAAWREQSLDCLRAAEDLELISVWSPTFLLQLLGDVGDTCALWPRLKVISCWASG